MNYLCYRLGNAVIVTAGVCTLVFLLIHVVPGDPVEVILGETATAADREALRASLGLDQPLLQQWLNYLQGLARLELGQSLYSGEPVSGLLVQHTVPTLELTLLALCCALLIALPLGILAALRQGTLWDRTAMAIAVFGVSIPNFWMGPMLILIFSFWLGWFPVSGRQEATAIVLPALTLGTALAGVLSRMIRASLLEVLQEEYLTAARARGLHPLPVLIHHALRNASLPVVTVLGMQLGALLAGAVITETVFAWPGIGQLLVEAIQRRDYPVLQACVLLISLGYVLVNLLTDLLYASLDPRVRLHR